MDKFIVIKPIAGLCNRLRFLFSFIHKMKKENIKKKLVVIWELDSQCNGFLWDIIKPIENCWTLRNNNKNFTINISSCGTVPVYKDCNYLRGLSFKPTTQIMNNIIKIIKNLNNKYVSIHIRRTDLTNHLKYINKLHLYTKDNDFITFLNKNTEYNIYLATDNTETQNKFLKLYPERIKYIKKIDNINKIKNHRKTDLQDALTDIFVCALSNKFKGTYFSSFSSFIELIRRDNNIKNNFHNNPLLLTEKYK